MPLLAATRPGWFDALFKRIRSQRSTVSVAVYHPELRGRIEFESGEPVRLASNTGALSEQDLERVGAGGYFEVHAETKAPRPMLVCVEPESIHGACREAERAEVLDAMLERRYRDVLALYAQSCASCTDRDRCESARSVERNVDRLLALTAPGGVDTLT